jgi:hypothetical protein
MHHPRLAVVATRKDIVDLYGRLQLDTSTG